MAPTPEEIYKLIISSTDYPYLGDTIKLFVGGSEAHGAKLDSKSDLDLLGVYIPPIEEVVGVRGVNEHYVWSTAGDKVRNAADDIDMTMYSLRKWAKLVTSGNPTAIEFLFTENHAPKPTVWETFISANYKTFLSAHAGLHFKGFCEHMLRTLKGEGVGKRGQRPDLIAEYGYDTKAAMHLIRVLNEGIELMQTSRITLPRPEKEHLVDIRRGKAGTLKDIEDIAQSLFRKLEVAIVDSVLPPSVDLGKVSDIVTSAQQTVWNDSNEVLTITAKAFSIASWYISEGEKLNPSRIPNTEHWQTQQGVQREMVTMAMEIMNKERAEKTKT
jgi:uncharacterized protein